jgi:hypothetical protein
LQEIDAPQHWWRLHDIAATVTAPNADKFVLAAFCICPE